MSIRYKLGKMSPLLPDEVILHTQRWFRAITSTSLPSYRISSDVPPVVFLTLLVTNRRVRLLATLFVFFTQEIDLWYKGKEPDNRAELITGVSVENGLFGRCVQITSFDPKRTGLLYWSPYLTLRVFIKNPEELESIICEAMTK